MSKTAVDWLIKEFKIYLPSIHHEGLGKKFEQAKEMEKKQIVNAVDGFPLENRHLCGEDYYNETYGKEAQNDIC